MKYDKDAQNPEVFINGEIAYVPQKPWIMNGSVKDNIIFNSAYDQDKLNDVIKYACLERDLQILTDGINTMIGLFYL